MSRRKRSKPQSAGADQSGAQDTAPSSTPAPDTPPGLDLHGFETRFRQLVDQATGSLREQAEAFETVLQAAGSVATEKQALAEVHSTLEARTNQLESRCKKLETRLADAAKREEQLKHDCESLRHDIGQRDEQLQAAGGQEQDSREQCVTLEQQLATVNATLESEIAQSRKNAEDFAQTIDALRAGVSEYEQRCRTLEDEVTNGVREQSELQAALELLELQAKEQAEAVATANDRLASTDRARQQLESERDALAGRVVQLEPECAGLRQDLAASNALRTELEQARSTLAERVDELEEDCRVLHAQVSKADEEQDRLRTTRTSLEACLSELSSRCQDLELERQHPAEERAAAKELKTLRSRCEELEAHLTHSRSKAEELQARCLELEAREPGDSTESQDRSTRTGTAERELMSRVMYGVVNNDSNARHRRRLLRDLLDLSTLLEASESRYDEIPTEDEPFNPHKLVLEVCGEYTSSARLMGLKMVNQLDPELPTGLEGDIPSIRRLISWATSFAVRRAASGEIVVMATTERGGEEGMLMRCSVVNDGAGLSSEELDRILGRVPDPCSSALVEYRTRLVELADQLGGSLRIEPLGKHGFCICLLVAVRFAGDKGDRRDSGRVLQEMLQCSLGPVVDLSKTGARVICTKPPKGRVELQISDHRSSVMVHATVVWSKKIDRKHYEAGLRFLGLQPGQSELLGSIAKRCQAPEMP